MVPGGDYAGRIVGFADRSDPGKWRIGDRVCPHSFVLGEGMTGDELMAQALQAHQAGG